MIPRILFEYSWIYDEKWKMLVKPYRRKTSRKYPSSAQTRNYIRKVERMWRKDEKKVLRELSRITGLKWKAKTIPCYVVGRCTPISDPLTVPVCEKYPNYFIDTLIHEMIHQLFCQKGNSERMEKVWNYIDRKYSDEPFETRIHIPLHAIHSHIYLKFYGMKRLERDIRQISFLPEYKRSWMIVRKEGYQNIIREFRKRLK